MKNTHYLFTKLVPLALGLFAISTGYSQTLTTSNLPIVLINTEGQTINDEPGIVCSLTIINNATGTNSITDPANEFDGKAKIEYRGCSSQNYPKKPLGIELRSTTTPANSINMPLFGFPAESDWVLNPSYIDKSFMRDVLAFYVANASGRYASRFKFVEVMINGAYQGIFIFEEKVKRDAGRINVNKMAPTDLGNNSITGGYVVKIDKACGNYDPNHQWQSAYASPGGTRNHYWQTDYPTDGNIAPQQFTYIENYINSFETMMVSSSCCAGYSSFIADTTFADYFLAQELSSNSDGYRFSTYLSKERNSKGGKLSAGPVWDFNLAFGFLTSPFNGNAQSYEGWRYTGPGDSSSPVPFWWDKLLACPAFGALVVARYKKLRQTGWNTATLTTFIDNQYAMLNQGAFSRNFQKWPIIGVPTWGDQPSYNGATLEDEFSYLKTWLTNRLDWMDQNICGFTTLPTATISTTPIQPGQSAPLTMTFTGSAPYSFTLSSGQTGTATSTPTTMTVSPAQTTTYTLLSVADGCGTGTVSGTALVTVMPPSPPDLTPTIYAQPTTLYGTSPVYVVVDVFEIMGIPTSAPITVRIARDQLLSLSLNTNAVSVNGHTVQNSDWTLNAMDPSVYVLTTTRSIAGGDKLSFGLEGTLTPGNTSGTLTVSCLIVGGSSGEVVVSNNTSANKIDYFQQ